jgi:hypothetical protein
MATDLITSSLRMNAAFVSDMRALLELDPALYQPLREKSGSVSADITAKEVEEAEAFLPGGHASAVRYVYTMNFLASRIAETGADPQEFLGELEEVTKVKVEGDRAAALLAVLRPSNEETEYSRAAQAFSFGNTYLGSTFNEIFAYGVADRSDVLYPGFNWVLQFRTGGIDTESQTINLSAQELRELGQRMVKLADGVEQKLAKLKVVL